MFVVKAAFCRVFQKAFRLAIPFMPYREPEKVSSCEYMGELLRKKGVEKALIVTDRGIEENGLTLSVYEALEKSGINYAIYAGVMPNPTVQNVEEAFSIYKKQGCEAIIAIGGGSSIDCGKAVGARAVYPNKSIGSMKGILKVLKKLPPLTAIPTTAGTGSETTLAAVITDSESRDKYALMSFPLIPHIAVLDPELTYSLPSHLTATTGMDALTHAVEAYIGGSSTKETRALAREAVSLVFGNIKKAYDDGKNYDARKNMLDAAYKAGVAFSKSYVGYIHAMAHSLGGYCGTPHGLANAVIMPYVLKEYGECVYKKLHELAVCAGVSHDDDSDKEGALAFISAIERLNREMNIPDKLQGIKLSDIPMLARHAEKEANPLYPVPKLMTAKELERIYLKVADWSV